MEEGVLLKIVIDGMGGDHAPQEIVKGVVDAAQIMESKIIITGHEEILHKEFSRWGGLPKKVEIYHAPETISMDEAPAKIIKKTNSPLIAGANLLKEGRGDALVSAGNTGATLAAGIFVIGRLKSISRPAIATILPSKKKPTLLIDAGANAEFNVNQVIQFAQMASIYMNRIMAVENPRVGLLNVGSEDSKGNKNYQEANDLLKETNLNYVGNVEGRDIMSGELDIVVCDGFVGNVALKVMEGTAETLVSILKESIMDDFWSKIGALFMKKALQTLKNRLDFEEHGGAPLLGLNKPVIVCHGGSKAKAIKNALLVGKNMIDNGVVEEISKLL